MQFFARCRLCTKRHGACSQTTCARINVTSTRAFSAMHEFRRPLFRIAKHMSGTLHKELRSFHRLQPSEKDIVRIYATCLIPRLHQKQIRVLHLHRAGKYCRNQEPSASGSVRPLLRFEFIVRFSQFI